jgi:hypothetical protein
MSPGLKTLASSPGGDCRPSETVDEPIREALDGLHKQTSRKRRRNGRLRREPEDKKNPRVDERTPDQPPQSDEIVPAASQFLAQTE